MKLIKPFFFAAENNKAQKALSLLKKKYTSYTLKNSNVIALDLSFNSLAYAKRKSNEFGIKNHQINKINYAFKKIFHYFIFNYCCYFCFIFSNF